MSVPSQSAPMCLCAHCTAQSICYRSSHHHHSYPLHSHQQEQLQQHVQNHLMENMNFGTDIFSPPPPPPPPMLHFCCQHCGQYIELVRNRIAPSGRIIHLSCSNQTPEEEGAHLRRAAPKITENNNNNSDCDNNYGGHHESPKKVKRFRHLRGVSNASTSSLGGCEGPLLFGGVDEALSSDDNDGDESHDDDDDDDDVEAVASTTTVTTTTVSSSQPSPPSSPQQLTAIANSTTTNNSRRRQSRKRSRSRCSTSSAPNNDCDDESLSSSQSAPPHLTIRETTISQVHMNSFSSNLSIEDRYKFCKIYHMSIAELRSHEAHELLLLGGASQHHHHHQQQHQRHGVAHAFAMIDGHGGSSCSQYVYDHLLETVQRYISYVFERRQVSIQRKSWLAQTLHYSEEQWRQLEEMQSSREQVEMFQKLRLFFDDSRAIPMALCQAFHSVDSHFLNETASNIVRYCNEQQQQQQQHNGHHMVVNNGHGSNQLVMQNNHQQVSIPKEYLTGSCALVAYFYRNRMYVANAGDCRCILARKVRSNLSSSSSSQPSQPSLQNSDGVGSGSGITMSREPLEAIQCSRDHKASDPVEQERLRRQFPNEDDIVHNGRVKGKLQPTRAFGDIAFKHELSSQWMSTNYRSWNPPYVTVDPEITQFSLDPSLGIEFVVLATDGLFDFLSNQQVVDIIQEYFLQHSSIPVRPTQLGNVCDILITNILQMAMTRYCNSNDEFARLQTALNLSPERRRKFFDDVSVTVIFLSK